MRFAPPVTGLEPRLYQDENLDHVETATNAYRDDRIYRWLLYHSSALPDVGGQPAPDKG